MKKVQFNIKDKTLFIDYKNENNVIKNINNTNIITDDDLIFDSKYLKNNMNLVAGFLNVIVTNEKVTNAIVKDESLILLTFDLLNMIPSITYLLIQPEIPIDYKMHLAILKNDTLKTINCYNIPTYLLERIDTTKSVKIETRNEVFFISNFIRINNLNNYSDVFYKKKLIINYDFNEADWSDFETFLTINSYLKVLYFEYISLNLIKNVMKYLKEYKKSNIKINIKGTKENLAYFGELENYAKKSKFIKKNKIQFRIDYTQEYKKENFIKLMNFTTLKYLLVIVIISCIAGYGINSYDLYLSSQEIDNINSDISDLLEEFENSDDVDPEQPAEEPTPETPSTPTTPAPPSAYYKDYSQVISVLKQTNPDTVGWLTVNNTKISYPVVQATNNSYYLTHDFNKRNNSMGWIFMDYRNTTSELQQNTIIFGHNISSSSKLMFGNLSATQSAIWYTNEANQLITFNTEYTDMKWRIFSIYKVANTNDYLYNTFTTQADFLSFINMVQGRSIYNFGVTIKEHDKILTLSTCQNSGKNRLVVHAVLVS